MNKLRAKIESEWKEVERLHKAVHETYLNRNKDRLSWEKACEAFHSFRSELDGYFERIFEEKIYSDKELQAFVIEYLDVNPMYFRSGYIKQEMITKIKRSPLSEKSKDRLRDIVIKAINGRPFREFKYYCRLAATLKNSDLVSAVETIVNNSEGARKSRASLVLKYLNNAHT